MPWMLNDASMNLLAEISFNNLAVALESIGENEKALYFRNQALSLGQGRSVSRE
jgi:hypothetical protein